MLNLLIIRNMTDVHYTGYDSLIFKLAITYINNLCQVLVGNKYDSP